jgi:hypothetical protein
VYSQIVAKSCDVSGKLSTLKSYLLTAISYSPKTRYQFLLLLVIYRYLNAVHFVPWARGGVVVEALRYKPEDRGIDSRWCHGNFPLTLSFRPHYDSGVDSASNRNEYQEYFLTVKAAGA